MHVDCCHWMLPGWLCSLYSVDLLDSSSSPPADLGPSGGSSSLSDVFSLPPLPHGQVQSNLVASTPPQSSDLLADLGLSLGSLPPAGMHSCVCGVAEDGLLKHPCGRMLCIRLLHGHYC